MPSKDKRKLAAIMFADVVSYSRMMASNEERTLELLKDFENICSPIIADYEGVIIKKVGDELFCEFSSAKQAVDCALTVQREIHPYNDSRPKDYKLQVRIGIHVGDIVLRDGDVFGDGVNVASRIQPFASPGGICISSSVKEALSSHPKYNIKSEGQQELKNIIEKHTLYRVETGFEDKKMPNKYFFNLSMKKYLAIASILLMFLSGYYIYKYYNIVSNWKSIQQNIVIEGDYIYLIDKIISEDGLFIFEKLKEINQKFSPYNYIIVSDTTLVDIYNELLSSLSRRMPTSVKFITRNILKNEFESNGEQVPTYDLRIERNFLKDMERDFTETAKEFYDSSTNYIMVKSGANLANFIILAEITNPQYNDKYAYLNMFRKLKHDGEIYSHEHMSIGVRFDIVSRNHLVNVLTDEIITDLNKIVSNNMFVGEIISINENEILFKYDRSFSDLIDEDYILNCYRKYTDFDILKNDLIKYETKLMDSNDTTSIWYKEFYAPKAIGWSKYELKLLKTEKYYSKKGDLRTHAGDFPQLKIINLYDTTGIAIIYKINNPYQILKVGDNLTLD